MLPLLSEKQVDITYAGYCAFFENSKNPYIKESKSYRYWQEGFDFSKKHNKNKVEKLEQHE